MHSFQHKVLKLTMYIHLSASGSPETLKNLYEKGIPKYLKENIGTVILKQYIRLKASIQPLL
jgi:hypothetical protein